MVPRRFVVLTEQEVAQFVELLSDDADYKAFAKAVGIDRTKGVLLQRLGLPVSEQYRQLRGVPDGFQGQQMPPQPLPQRRSQEVPRMRPGSVDLTQQNIQEEEMMEEGYDDEVPPEGQEVGYDEGVGGGFPQQAPPQSRMGGSQQTGLRGPQNQGRQQSNMPLQAQRRVQGVFQPPIPPETRPSPMVPGTIQRQSGMPSQAIGGSQNQSPLRRGSPPEGLGVDPQSKEDQKGSEEVDEFGEFVEEDF